MWLSKKSINNGAYNNSIENGDLTISNASQLETNGSANCRNIRAFSPYGYSYIAPSGEEALVLNASFGKAIAGVKMNAQNIKNGEIKISNASGAYILLRNDGSIEINGKIFEKGGN